MRRFTSFLILLFAVVVPATAETNALPLTLHDAEELALKVHPRITIAELRALVAKESDIEARSPFFPSLTGNATVVGTDGDNNRVAAGGLNNPIIYDRGAFGLTVNWQVFDFGRTWNLLESARLHARAAQKNVEATRAQILLLVDFAYFSSLQAKAVRQVAEQTVNTRQLLRDQVALLAANRLKSELDVSFAETALAEASVLMSRAENDEKAAQSRLAALLGDREGYVRLLADEPPPAVLADEVHLFIAAALANRPEVARLSLERDAAKKFADAERALHYPVISAIGVGGLLPEHNSKLPDNYLAAGLNLSLPIFNGWQFESRRKAALLKSRVAAEELRGEEEIIISDVRVAWLNARNAAERVGLTEKLFQTASRSFELAEARYKAGISSLAELTQSQLNKTTAEVALATARYEQLIQRAVLDFQTGHKAGSQMAK
ncbi:MAG: TolC family protein [Verrucomicrobia bacterium]|nr:TolC family protein [Verrucomicrobiota bacterium]